MAQISYVDSDFRSGAIDLAKVEEGDVIRMRAEFHKEGDGDFAGVTRSIEAGALGTVLSVRADGPRLRATMPATTKSSGGMTYGQVEVELDPGDVDLLVDAHDPRLSSVRDRHAHVIRAAAMADWLGLVLWSLEAAGDDFPGAGNLSIKSRRHVAWALRENADDIRTTIPVQDIDRTDDDELSARVADELEGLADRLATMSDDEWRHLLPSLAEWNEDADIARKYRESLGIEEPEPDVPVDEPEPEPEPELELATDDTAFTMDDEPEPEPTPEPEPDPDEFELEPRVPVWPPRAEFPKREPKTIRRSTPPTRYNVKSF